MVGIKEIDQIVADPFKNIKTSQSHSVAELLHSHYDGCEWIWRAGFVSAGGAVRRDVTWRQSSLTPWGLNLFTII